MARRGDFVRKISALAALFFVLFCTGTFAAQTTELDIAADTYVVGGSHTGENYGAESVLCAKRETTNGTTGNTDRRIYMKISLADYAAALDFADSVTLSVTTVDTAGGVIYATDWTDWQESGFVMNDEPYSAYADIESNYEYVGEITAAKDKRVGVDITAAAKKLAADGKAELTLVFVGDNNPTPAKRTNLRIYSRESAYKPTVRLSFAKEFSARLTKQKTAGGIASLEYEYANVGATAKSPAVIVAGYAAENGVRRLSGVKHVTCAANEVGGKISAKCELPAGDEVYVMLWDGVTPVCGAVRLEEEQRLTVLLPQADAYVSDSANHGAENTLYTGKSGSAERKSYLRFDISELAGSRISGAYLILYNTSSAKSDGGSLYLAEASGDWTEGGITPANAPAGGERIAVSCILKGMTSSFDLGDYISAKAYAGAGEITLVLSDNGLSGLVGFASREDADRAPRLVVSCGSEFCYPKAAVAEFNYRDTDPLENARALVAGSRAVYGSDISCEVSVDDDDYTERVSAKRYVTDRWYNSYKTRTLESLPGFAASDSAEELCKYGGLIRKSQKATGYFYINTDADGSHLVDPCGHTMLLLGLDSVESALISDAVISEKYQTRAEWAKQTASYVKSGRLFMNSAVNWTSFDQNLLNTENPPAMMLVIGVLTNYAKRYGLAVQQAGHLGFKNNNCMPVFDPYFEVYANNFIAGNIEKYRTNKNIIGYFSDNELPIDKNMLLEYLMLDPSDGYNAYSHAAAWEWLRSRTGKEKPTLADVTVQLNDDFYDFVYDRYYQVVEPKYRKYAPNHLYFGERMMSYNNATYPGIVRASGRYADAMVMNYYGVWTPNTGIMQKWHEWSGKPFFITEWYAKGEDSEYQTQSDSGAGFICQTQSDRGKFYQNFALKLLEDPNCVGFVWFGYMDTANTNKGVVSPGLDEYTEFAKRAARFNRNAYRLMEFFRESE